MDMDACEIAINWPSMQENRPVHCCIQGLRSTCPSKAELQRQRVLSFDIIAVWENGSMERLSQSEYLHKAEESLCSEVITNLTSQQD